MATGTLGCAQRYDAAIHWQGGTRRFYHLQGVTSVNWGRKLGDYSEATVMLAKPHMTRQCFDVLSPKYNADGSMARPGISPWAHELSIYRDGLLVWQGPIVLTSEKKNEVEIHARDMLAWMDRRVVDINLHGGHPDGSRFRGETGTVLRQIMERTWPGNHETRPYDNPGITEHARVDYTPDKYTETERIWKGSRTVGDLVRDIIANGIDMFTLGRKVYMIPDFYRVTHQPYRLTEDHVLGDIEVRTLGLDMATEGFVAGQEEGSGQNGPPIFGKWPPQEGPGGPNNPSTMPYYGRITRFHEAQSLSGDEGPDQSQRALQQVARSIRAYGFPAPKAVIISDSAQLAPEAPITIGQLVPGRVVRIELQNYVSDVSELFRMNEIEVSWSNSSSSGGSSGGTSSGSSQSSSGGSTSSSGGGGETVEVSLATLRNPPIPSEEQGSSSGGSTSSSASTT